MNFHRKPNIFVSRVDIKVEHLERSIAFYQDVIGFQVIRQTNRTAHLSADGETVILTLEQPEDVQPKRKDALGLYHFAILLPTRAHLAQIVRHFAQIGLRFGSSDHLVSEALYFSDPDGNGIEIYRDRNPSEWTWRNEQVDMAVDPLDFDDLLQEPPLQPWHRLPPETVMGHIHLHVAELQRVEEFYVRGLGFEVVCRFGSQALFISTGKYHHHIGLNTWLGPNATKAPYNSVGLTSFTLAFPDESALLHTVSKLKELGFPVEEFGGTFTITDPSGNQIQLESHLV